MDPNLLQSESDAKNAKKEQEEKVRGILATLLEAEALERLSRIALVNPGRSKHIEDSLLVLLKSRAGQQRLSDQDLVDLLVKLDKDAQGKAGPGIGKPAIVYARRKGDDFAI